MIQIIQGDCLQVLKTLPDESVHCVVTSPPYWGLRDYGVEGQLGLEKTPEEYVAKMVTVFREVRRVLRKDGTLWLNLGDSYACTPVGKFNGGGNCVSGRDLSGHEEGSKRNKLADSGLKPKDLCGIPWRLAFALQADGWWLRSEIIWAKRNCMPESVTDRPTKSHEQVFLLTKSQSYFYDAEAVKVPASESYANDSRWETGGTEANYKEGYAEAMAQNPKMPHRVFNGERRPSVNLRDVWHISSEPFPESHFATFPTALVKPCILAGTSAKGCCPKCGAPWEREVNRVPAVSKPCPKTTASHLARGGIGEPVGTVGKSGGGRIDGFTETLGWYPSCRCNNDDDDCEVEPIPCTVLDPFGGSGTVGQVAMELGRKAILIELNPEYVKLAEKRTNVTPGLQLA